MKEATVTLEDQLPNSPIVEPEFKVSEIYKLIYKDRNQIITIHFRYHNDAPDARTRLQGAIERSKRYCEMLRYRFFHCELFITDLDEKEKVQAVNY